MEPSEPAAADPSLENGESETLVSREDSVRRILFAEAFRFWVKLGFISFGGPAGQIAIMHKELVDRRRWLSDERFLHALNYCMLLPGPEAQQLAIYIGWLMHRTWGGVVAGFFFVFPSVFILLILSYIYAAYGNVPAVAGVLAGFKPIVVAIVVEAVVKIGGKALKRSVHYVIAASAFISIYFLHIPFPLIVLAAALIGLAGIRFLPHIFAAQTKNNKDSKQNSETDIGVVSEVPLVIRDDAAPPPHTVPNKSRIFKILGVGLALWLVPFALIGSWNGWDSLHAQEYRFFTQAALVTFGGAYAVLAYVSQAAAGSFAWITQSQAVDGLALAETTPGPLIMVLQFIGFMAAWNNPVGGMSPAQSGIIGALITTYVTFLPSFLFIFIGAPYIESLRNNRNLTGALSGVTAAVVGVVLNLALVFGVAVVFPNGYGGNTEWFSAVMSIAAFVALYKFKADVLLVVLIGGLIGFAKNFLM
ncbi:MAG: chromate efflux transporter [Acidobacteria bacterium]|nr:chromate efflux transporter [Acidobacteriota bacterium]